MHDIFDEYKIAFLEETQENLDQLNDDLISLEKDHGNKHLIDSIFRMLHTLKSSAAAVGFNDLSHYTHQAEDLVQQIRNGQREITAEIVNVLFQVFDIIQTFLQQAQSEEQDPALYDPSLQQLKKYQTGRTSGTNQVSPEFRHDDTAARNLPEPVIQFLKNSKNSKKKLFEIRIQIDPAEPIKWLRAELIVNHAQRLGEVIALQPEKAAFQSDIFNGEFTVFLAAEAPVKTIQSKISADLMQILSIRELAALTEKPQNGKSGKNGDETSIPSLKSMTTSSSIRVPVRKLDDIMHLVGELVVANSALKMLEQQIQAVHRDDSIAHEMNLMVDKFAKLSTSLQSRILKTRMLPIRTLFNQYNRVVRDLSMKEDKEINLIIHGEETELDKKVIDAMGDPLTHLIRNAVDHGIETPAERERLGKFRQGTIMLSAAQAGHHIIISIKDDGRGLNVAKIREKVIERGFMNRDMAEEMPDSEILNVIFEPGFSTADQISSVSGRGVGLDVVNNTINSLNGSIQIESEPGQGTEFIVHLPLTLAISTVIVAEAGQTCYGIPISDIRETIKVPSTELNNRKAIHILNWTDRVIPVLNFDRIMDGTRRKDLPVDAHGNVSIIIVSYRDRELGLIVDKIIGKQEIVMKPLEEHYKSIRGLSGAAILGDGTVILISDVLGILQIARDIEEKEKKIKRTEVTKENSQSC